MAYWIDALASRSGPLSDAALQFGARQGVERDPPRGVAGLCALSQWVVRFARQLPSDDDERDFIEGAGAYFALLLLDQLGAGSHQAQGGVHRLQVGRYGSWDPFASIARVLEADDVRRALLTEVSAAEAEARGDGPVSRVLAELERQLAQLPDARVLEFFDRKIAIASQDARIELDLTRIVEVTSGESAATVSGAVRRMVAALSPEPESDALPWEAAAERLFPRLVGRAFLDALPDHKGVHLLPLAAGVWVTLVLRYKERARYVRQAEVETWSKDGASPRAQALQNLARSCGRARFLQHDGPDGPLVIAESRDGLDSARLLLPGLHELLTRTLGSPCIVAVPHRDALLACTPTGPRMAQLQARVNEAVLRAPHAITRSLLLLHESGRISDFPSDESAVAAY